MLRASADGLRARCPLNPGRALQYVMAGCKVLMTALSHCNDYLPLPPAPCHFRCKPLHKKQIRQMRTYLAGAVCLLLAAGLTGCGQVGVSNSGGSNTGGTPTAVAPAITRQPANAVAALGTQATFSVGVTGTSPLTYQWLRNGAVIPGATGTGYTTQATTSADNGAEFSVIVSNVAGSVTSSTALLTVVGASGAAAPVVTTQPANQTVSLGRQATFVVAASGSAPLTYQWRRNGAAISGATAASYTTPAT